MKRQYVTLFSILTLLLAVVGVAGAQEPTEPTQPTEPEATVVTGTAVNASPAEIIIKTETGEEVFLIEKEDLYPEPIAEGAKVSVWFVERGGYKYATKLEVEDALPATASSRPLLALLGLIGLAGAAAVWKIRT